MLSLNFAQIEMILADFGIPCGSFGIIASKTLSCLVFYILTVPYSRNESCALTLISTFLLGRNNVHSDELIRENVKQIYDCTHMRDIKQMFCDMKQTSYAISRLFKWCYH